MADTNIVVIVGRLTRDAELKYTAGGMAVCKFAIAVNRRKKDGEEWVEEASFFDIVLWGRSGEALNQYLLKGKQVSITGSLHQNRWEQDGQARSKIEIMAENVQLLGGTNGAQGSESGRRGTQSGSGDTGTGNRPPPSSRTPPKSSAPAPDAQRYDPNDDSVPPDFPDDIPF